MKKYIFFFINQILKIFKHMFISLKKLLSQQIRNLEPFFFTLWVSKFLAGVEITSIDGIAEKPIASIFMWYFYIFTITIGLVAIAHQS